MTAQVVDAVRVMDRAILFLDVDGPKTIFHDKERFFIAFVKGIGLLEGFFVEEARVFPLKHFGASPATYGVVALVS